MTPSENALSYLGQTEIHGNAGFTDPKFEAEMKEEGWQKGWAWCSVFAKVVFKNCYPENPELDKLFSASAVQTYKNFRDAAYIQAEIPEKDMLVIWQQQKEGKPQWQGHAGIVVNVIDKNTFESVEGNTNDGGGREGYIVAKKLRKVQKVQNGLQVLGFIRIHSGKILLT